jgi:hypothetical protein
MRPAEPGHAGAIESAQPIIEVQSLKHWKGSVRCSSQPPDTLTPRAPGPVVGTLKLPSSLAAWRAQAGYDTVARVRTLVIVMLALGPWVFELGASGHTTCRTCTSGERRRK